MVAVQILKAGQGPDRKGVPAMSMAKDRIRKTGKKTDRNTSTEGAKVKFGGLP